MRMNKLIFIALAGALALAGCHRDTRPAWQRAHAAEHLKIPEGIDSPGRSGEMSVPAATTSVEGTVHDDTTPPGSITLDTDSGVDAAWQQVTAKVGDAGVGTVLSRDDQAHHLGVTLKGSEIPQPKRGFFSRMFHHAPDPDRVYYATVEVVSENGKTLIRINGDGPAVLRLNDVLKPQPAAAPASS